MTSLSDLTAKCIRCGFCLESCPTYMISGRETESPRGRIYLAKQADEGKIKWADTRHSFDTCLGCRACEPACPSGVEYGKILDIARRELGGGKPLLRLIDRVSDVGKVAAVAKIARFIPGGRIPNFALRGISEERQVAGLPHPPPRAMWQPLDETTLPPVKGDVYLLEGCAMKALYPHVHQSLQRLLRRVGYDSIPLTGCCGALHLHSGFHLEGERRMTALLQNANKDIPIVVDSAGCGSALKEHSTSRVFDASEFLFDNGLAEPLMRSIGINMRITYHDACHLGHAQGIKEQPRALLKSIPQLTFQEMQEADVCCGSAGVYNFIQPTRALALQQRKWANVLKSRVEVVATGNPGCLAWIEQAARHSGTKVKVRHTLEVLEASFSGTFATE